MTFTIVIPVLNQFEEAYGYLDSWFALSKGKLDVLFIDNGSDEQWGNHEGIAAWRAEGHNITVLRNEVNTGVYPTFQQGYDHFVQYVDRPQWIFYSHSDVEMLVPGWDVILSDLLESLYAEGAGVCGMFGAKGIGTADIYKAPYNFTQMMRWCCHTVESMVDAGGIKIRGAFERIMVLDGFSLIINTDVIRVMDGFDHERYPVHHMYDNDICLESHYHGFKNYALSLDCIHHGGMTSTREKWAETMGTTDLEIHRAAHKVFYEKWRGKIPIGVQ